MTEFPEALQDLEDRIEGRDLGFIDYCRPSERVILDVCRTIAGIEGEGLYSFWSFDLEQDRIIRSFDRIGAARVVDLLIESRRYKEAIVSRDYDSRENDFGEEEWAAFNRIEDELYREFPGVPELALDFARRHGVTGVPFGKVERILISCRHPVSSLLNLWIRPGEKIESSE